MIDCRELYKARVRLPDQSWNCFLVAAEDPVEAMEAVQLTYGVSVADVEIEAVYPDDSGDWIPPWSPCEWCDCFDDHDARMPCRHRDGPCYPARNWSRKSPGKSPDWLDMMECPFCHGEAARRPFCGSCKGSGLVRREQHRLPDHGLGRAEAMLEAAWGLIANAHGGSFDNATPEWKLAAEDWRDKYHGKLRREIND